jgi:hypothetical protein
MTLGVLEYVAIGFDHPDFEGRAAGGPVVKRQLKVNTVGRRS